MGMTQTTGVEPAARIYTSFINGAYVEAAGEAETELENPATLAPPGVVQSATTEQVHMAVSTGAEAQRTWSAMDPAERSRRDPPIFADVPPDADVFQEEVFGPVLCVTPTTDEDHAVSLANDSQQALASNVWTADLRRAFLVAERIEARTVWIGRSRLGDPHMSLRAAQNSGGSHFRGVVDVFTEEKLVAISKRDEDRGPHWALGAGRVE